MNPALRATFGFLAGALAVLTLHQGTIALLSAAGTLPPGAAYSLRAVPPLGVPQVLNLAFWGGLWGIVLAFAADRFAGRDLGRLALLGLVFGAVAPVLVGWFVVAPLKGQPVAQGWNLARMWIGPVVNGAWGLAAGLLYGLLAGRRRPRLAGA